MSDRTLIILSPGFAGSEDETSCLPAQQIFVKALQRTDPSLNIIIMAFQYPYKKKVYQWKGITVIPFGGKNRGHVFRRLLWVSVIKTLKALHKQNNIVGILSFWLGECAYVSRLIAKQYSIREYIWILGQDAKKYNPYVGRIRPKENTLVAISDSVAEELFVNYGLRPSYVIPIGIDTSMFQEAEVERDIDILGAGSLIPLKRYDLFIKLIFDLKEQHPGIRSVICGTGIEQKGLSEMITNAGLASNIELAGELPHQSVIDQMKRSRIFLHPSSYEGFSSVCAEALYSGAHVVSFCKPMAQGYLNWHVVSNYDQMYTTVLGLLTGPVSYDKVLAHSVEQSAATILDLYSH